MSLFDQSKLVVLPGGTVPVGGASPGDLAAGLAAKAPLASPAFTGTPTGITKTHVGLSNVDNTSDANKPVSTAQAAALAAKAPLASPAFTGTPTGITKTHVGLPNVDNTSDANKPVSTAQALALAAKATIGEAVRAQISDITRGETREAWSTVLTGEPDARAAIAVGDVVAVSGFGGLLRIRGTDVPDAGYLDVAPRRIWPSLPGVTYRVTMRLTRTADTVDPAGEAVQLLIQNLSGVKAAVSQGVIETLVPKVVDGERVISFTVSRDQDADYTLSTVYWLPHFRVFGQDALHAVGLIDVQVQDISATAGLTVQLDLLDTALAAETAARVALGNDLVARIPATEIPQNILPIADVGDGMLLWYGPLGLACSVMSPDMQRQSTGQLAPPQNVDALFGMIEFADGMPFTWRSDGVDIAPISQSFVDRIGEKLGSTGGGTGEAGPMVGDARSLSALRAAQAAVLLPVAGAQDVQAYVGDSWIMGYGFVPAIASVLATGAVVCDGWLSAAGSGAPRVFSLVGATWAHGAGWTVVDGSEGGPFAYGTGPDGQMIHTTLNTATSTLTVRATSIHILRRQYGGTWRYQLDGGAWNTVVEGTGGAPVWLDIPGLTDAVHVVNIDTVGNTGRVAICGAHPKRAGVLGTVIARFGDGGLRAARAAQYLEYLAPALEKILPHVLLTLLGTNDARTGAAGDSTPPVYVQYLSDLTDVARDAVGLDVGIIHIIPPEADNAPDDTPLEAYRAATAQLAAEKGTTWFSCINLFGSFATSDARGLWSDGSHVSDTGGVVIARGLKEQFFTGSDSGIPGVATARALVIDGTAALPGMAFDDDQNTGLFRPGADQIGFATNGVQRMLLGTAALEMAVPITGLAVTQSQIDATPGRLLRVGNFGVGGLAPLLLAIDPLDNSIAPGTYHYDTSLGSTGGPTHVTRGHLHHSRRAAGGGETQVLVVESSGNAAVIPGMTFSRSRVTGGWTAWIVGSIVETLSTANGRYTRMADGSQTCTHLLASSAAGEVTWTFPAAFSTLTDLRTVHGVNSSALLALSPRFTNRTTTSLEFSAFNASNARVAVAVELTATGRWF